MSNYVAAVPAWVRAMAAVVTIPALWAAELWAGLTVLRFPEVIFGEGANFFGLPPTLLSVAVALAVVWIIYRTPFVVLSMTFPQVANASSEAQVAKEVETSE